jgi:hypothetical protein
MKKYLLILIAFLIGYVVQAQVVKKDYKDFDKVEIFGVNADVKIELGKSFDIQIKSNDQSDTLLTFELKKENTLSIGMKKKKSWKYSSENNFTITITMPEISKLFNSSNGDITVNNFIGRYLGIKNVGNGAVTVKGTQVDELEVSNYGNGGVNAKDLTAKKAIVTNVGNGDINLSTNEAFEVSLSGNGDVVNYGKGKATIISKAGNGEVIYKD